MKINKLILKNLYVWTGEALIFYYIDENNINTAVTFTIEQNGAVVATFTGSTDANGLYTGNYTIGAATPPTSVFTLKAGGLSVIFAVDYRGHLIARGLEILLHSFLKIPVYNELAEIQTSGTENYATFTYKNWDPDSISDFIFRLENTDLVLYTDIFPDISDGKARIKTASYEAGKDVYASYKFKFFDEMDFGDLLQITLDELNAAAPTTYFNFFSAPVFYDPYLIMATYKKCIQRILLDVEFWNNKVIFPEVTGLRASLNILLQAATTECIELKKSAKRRALIHPLGVNSFKMSGPRPLVDGLNYRFFTVIGTSANFPSM